MKGFFSLTAKFLVGLLFTILILIFFFKLFSTYGAIQEQQKAIASVQGLQTGINYVCTTKKPVIINIDLPQNVFGGKGESLIDALARGIYNAFSEKKLETAKEMATYTFSIENYGDPWYIIYYEFFPQGEDYGWRNWHKVAGTSIVEVAFFFTDAITCTMPFAKSIAISVKESESAAKFAKLLKLDIASERLNAIRESFSESKVATKLGKVFSIFKRGGDPQEKEIALKEVYESAKKEGKLSIAYQTFKSWMTKSILTLRNEREAAMVVRNFRIIQRNAEDLVELSDSLKSLTFYSPVKEDLDDLLALSKEIKELFEKDGKAIEVFEKSQEIASKVNKVNADISTALLEGNDKYQLAKRYLDAEELETLKKAIVTMGNSPSDITLYLTSKKIDSILLKLDSIPEPKAKQFSKDIRNWILLQKKLNRIKSASNYLKAIGKSKLIGKAKWYLSLYTEAGIGLTRVAKWQGYRLIVSAFLSPLEFSFLKFNPTYCQGNTLCLKNVLSWDILKFPLDDCKQAGYNYIELEKLALDPVNFQAKAVSLFEGSLSYIYGNKPYSRFYLASPCQGKVLIIPSECEGNLKKEPIIAMDVFGNVELEEKLFTCAQSNYLKVSALYSNGTAFFVKNFTSGISSPFSTIPKEIIDPIYGTSWLENINIECDLSDQVLKIYGIEGLALSGKNRTICSQSFDTIELLEDPTKTEYYLPSSISCNLSLPKILGTKHIVTKESPFRLFCSKWNLTDNQTECDYSFQGKTCKRWCCLEWSITDGHSYDVLFNVSSCGDYENPLTAINNHKYWQDHLIDEYIPSGKIYSSEMKEIIEKEESEWNPLIELFCESCDPVIPKDPKSTNRIPCQAACSMSQISLSEKLRQYILSHYNQTFPASENLSSYSLQSLIYLSESSTILPTSSTFPCIKVYVIGNQTKGFCYTPPRNTQEILENVVASAGSFLSMIASMLGPEAAPACLIGSSIQYGSSWLAKELEKNSVWPYNFMLHSFKEKI